MSLNHQEFRVKTVILGNTTVGKTSFIDCFKNGPRDPSQPVFQSTQGPEFVNHKFVIENRVLKTNIWDTAGQERYLAINKTYYREAKGALLIADLSVTPKEESLSIWLKAFKSNADANAQVILVGNKLDLKVEEATVEMLERFSKKHGLRFFKMSAKTGENVELVMMELMQLIDKTYFLDQIVFFEHQSRRSEYLSLTSKNSLMSIDNGKKKDGKACCEN